MYKFCANLPAIKQVIMAALMWQTLTPAYAAPQTQALNGPVPATGPQESCAPCHAPQVRAWASSHHAKSMNRAGPDTVLGAFHKTPVLVHGGEKTIMSRKAGRFFATVNGQAFEILYTFGTAPLQQYLVETQKGRLQALPWAWDARPLQDGGQRWYHLYEDDTLSQQITPEGRLHWPEDRLHWKKPLQNWNGMCADCHSSGLTRNYNSQTDTFATTATAPNVSCASCHTQSADHTQKKNQSHKSPTMETCASCHSRRTPLTDKIDISLPFLDQFTPVLLDEGLYFADGQIRDEVYVWGSFMQSAMAQAGVTCTNCHDPHTQALKEKGNALCTSCHDAKALDARAHHHHKPGSPGADCANCHMPERTYMGIDNRRDHAFKVPRPDLAAQTGIPNACTMCHNDLSNEEAASHITQWFGPQRPDDTHIHTLARARIQDPAARAGLVTLIKDEKAPAILRATALGLIAHIASDQLLALARTYLQDEDPLLRMAAVRALTAEDPARRGALLAPLAKDPVKAVRMELARALRGVSPNHLAPEDQGHVRKLRAEAKLANTQIAWRGEGRLAQALMAQGEGNFGEAKAQYRAAMTMDPAFAPAWVNLSELLRGEGNKDEALDVLKQGLEKAPGDARLQHAMGLAQVRAGDLQGALAYLGRAARLAPQNARFSWVHAVALNEAEGPEAARAAAADALTRHPFDPNLNALAAALSKP